MNCIIKVRSPEEWNGVMNSISNKNRSPFQIDYPHYLCIEKDAANQIRVFSAPNIEAFGDGAQFILYKYYIANKENILFDILL